MDIIINSLYSNREIFLRELISNAADASDKMRYSALSDATLLGEGDLADLDIRVQFDKEKRTITITDKGIGMTKEDLKRNLGIMAKSGTSEFLEAAQASADNLSLIGQFGVGFYSVYLVADRVTVVSKNPKDKQHVWESTAHSTFTVSEDPRGNTLGRGTSITMHLKEDAEEFLEEGKLKEIVTRYSQFVNVPIYLQIEKSVSKEVPVEEDEEEKKKEGEADETEKSEDDVEVSDEDDEEKDDEPKTKTVIEKTKEWKHVNEAKAIWTRAPKDVTPEEYSDFFKTVTKNKFPDGALEHVHFTAEGEITFKSLLYIPKKSDPAAYNEMFSVKKTGVHLYVRRVLISDEFEDFLPRYMNFVRGVVDSDDLPLNVSRETLAESRILKVMGKKLVRKVLELLRKMSDAEEAVVEEEETTEGDKAEAPEKEASYEEFWKEHGKSIKFGVLDDRKNKNKLVKLLRFPTSHTTEKEVRSVLT
jgi:heat shock protein beta